MLSINMRIFKTVLLIAFVGAGVQCLPLNDESKTEVPSLVSSTITVATTTVPMSTRLDTDYYDQRQNGTENYRIQVDDVVLVFAPVEALLLAGNVGSTTESNLSTDEHSGPILIDGLNQPDKLSVSIHNRTEAASSKTIYRPAFRLANFLAPLLHRIHHEKTANIY